MALEKYRVFFKYDAHYYTKSVEIIGDFNQWQSGKTILRDDDGDNSWDCYIELPSGKYEYKFLIDGVDYRLDPNNILKVNKDGIENSLLLVGEAKFTQDVLHNQSDIDVFSDNTIYIRAAFNSKKFSNAVLILVINDIPKALQGYPLYWDENYSYYIFKLQNGFTIDGFFYYFDLEKTDTVHSFFGSNGNTESEWEVESLEFTKSGKSQLKTPDWVKDAIFYQIFPDRFNNGDKNSDPPGISPPEKLPKSDTFYGGDY